ncbi:Lysophospholipase, alpha-beta hydrolase superfamily [Pedobacter steynii]|uniref:Lysophospholipase, alpha-beta hydrolase superfamily n=1 Tax=Pedobacter steynii TaxID=430522 RepID=A0A1H0KME2_9SPHI|nr:alpha/beta fold hydrolase [Pedobacter steynii]NQX43328.1 alpha/beta hydrolase [Pedobacter steynii]SDO56973.1 Lysophospholipase, alpha-beta hydrolase superfamily [Pedobacter steynii]
MKIYLKSSLIAFIALMLFSPAYAQKNAIAELHTAAFIKYFNAGKADSLYTLMAEEVRSKLPLTTLGSAIAQIKGSLGNLTRSDYVGIQQGTDVYMATFEKPGMVLHINMDKANQVIGFFLMEDKRKLTEDKRELPGSVTINAGTAVLKGTLSLPQVTAPVPVVLLIAGSGPTDRDGNSLLINGKPNYFLQVSDALKSKNIAVFRYDKRGIGQSTSTKALSEVTFEDMAEDALAVIKMLKADKRFSKVIVAGHSEGSLIGMLASEREKPNAFISLSAPGVPADVILKTQLKSKVSTIDYAKAALIIDSIKVGHFTKQKMDAGFNMLFNTALQPYLYSWMKYDPKQSIKKLAIPVLIVQGTHDIQVSVNDAQLLKKAEPHAVLKLIPGMSHILKAGPADPVQNAATYTRSDLPLHPELIPTLVKFIDGLPVIKAP